MDEPIHVAVLAGTLRVQRKSILAARFVEQVGKSIEGVTTELVDPTQFYFEGDGNDREGKDPRYTEVVKRADAFFIVTPEYNHSFPGSLKRMLDSELRLYTHKPVSLAGVSDGSWGGARAVESLLHPLRTMGLIASFQDTLFPKIDEQFNEDGTPKDEQYYERVKAAYTELVWLARTLKWGRENLPNKYHEPDARQD